MPSMSFFSRLAEGRTAALFRHQSNPRPLPPASAQAKNSTAPSTPRTSQAGSPSTHWIGGHTRGRYARSRSAPGTPPGCWRGPGTRSSPARPGGSRRGPGTRRVGPRASRRRAGAAQHRCQSPTASRRNLPPPWRTGPHHGRTAQAPRNRCCGARPGPLFSGRPGGMAERFKAHAWKACWGQLLAGSNPAPSATCLRSAGNLRPAAAWGRSRWRNGDGDALRQAQAACCPWRVRRARQGA